MRQVTVTAGISGYSGSGYQTAPVILDQYIAPNQFNFVPAGISGFSGIIQTSVTDPYPFVNGTFVEADYVWVTGTSGYNEKPVRAVRLYGATEGDTLTVIQAGAL